MKNRSLEIEFTRKEGVFNAALGISREADVDLTYWFHPEEITKIKTFQHKERIKTYTNGRLASKFALSRICGQQPASIKISSGVFAFPVVNGIKDLNLQVSISHLEDLGLALAFPESHPMGIDIERVKSGNTNSLRNQLSLTEKTLISREANGDVKIHMIWSMKEALSKILRTGLMINFELLETQNFVQKTDFFEAEFRHHKQYKAKGFVAGKYVFALVFPKNSHSNFARLRDFLLSKLVES